MNISVGDGFPVPYSRSKRHKDSLKKQRLISIKRCFLIPYYCLPFTYTAPIQPPYSNASKSSRRSCLRLRSCAQLADADSDQRAEEHQRQKRNGKHRNLFAPPPAQDAHALLLCEPLPPTFLLQTGVLRKACTSFAGVILHPTILAR